MIAHLHMPLSFKELIKRTLKESWADNETYGTLGTFIVVLTWFYLSGLAILIGAELNAEIEHASPYGKAPGEKVPGEKKITAIWTGNRRAGRWAFVPAT